ncbi:GNAT family N-acetyltransferase [Humibacter soli]
MLTALPLPDSRPTRSANLEIRRATGDDLSAVVRLITDDPISAGRGDRNDPAAVSIYRRALTEVLDAPRNDLVLAVDAQGEAVGTLQLTLIPGMARLGATRLLVESVHVASTTRSSGIGTTLMRWVIDAAAPALGADLIQLTSDVARPDAHRFYERLGFVPSHIGFKYQIA